MRLADIASKLRELRAIKNVSCKDVDTALNLTSGTCSKLENRNINDTKIPVLNKIAEYFEITLEEFIGKNNMILLNKENELVFVLEGIKEKIWHSNLCHNGELIDLDTATSVVKSIDDIINKLQ